MTNSDLATEGSETNVHMLATTITLPSLCSPWLKCNLRIINYQNRLVLRDLDPGERYQRKAVFDQLQGD
jgi:hypothetical protein